MITTNLKQVASRIERLKTGIPAAVSRATSVKHWKARLEMAAEKTLKAMWALERDLMLRTFYEELTPRLVNTISGELLEGPVTRFSMGGKNGDAAHTHLETVMKQNLEGRLASGDRSKSVRMTSEDWRQRNESLEAVREGVLEWVKQEKHKETSPGGRDAGLSDEEIAERLEFILGLNQSPKERSGMMDQAAESLTPVIQKFLDQWVESGEAAKRSKTEINSATLATWLEAVLASWVALITAALPGRLQYEIGKEIALIQETMI